MDDEGHRVTSPRRLRVHATFKLIQEIIEKFMAEGSKQQEQNGDEGASSEEISSSTPLEAAPGAEASPYPPPPPSPVVTSVEVWAKYVKVQMLEALGEYSGALELVDSCISAVDDKLGTVDFCERKARLLKLSGDVQAAASLLDEARCYDLADRYINNKCTKYLLRAGKIEQAEDTISLFTRHEKINASNNLFEMQCSWFELEYAMAMQRRGDLGRALKKFINVERHFADFAEDQFDFHNWCVKRATLRAYSDILSYEEHVWDHKYYVSAATGIIECYLHLHDNPVKDESDDQPDFSKMTASEKKKAKAALRKKKKKEEEKKAREEEEEEAAAAAKASEEEKEKGTDGKKAPDKKPKPYVDPDPTGAVHLKKNAMVECLKLTEMLKLHCPHLQQTWLLNADVLAKKGGDAAIKDAVDGLVKAVELDPGSFQVFERIVNVARVNEDVAKDTLMGGVGVRDFVRRKFESGVQELSLKWRIALARCGMLTGALTEAECKDLILVGGMESEGSHLYKNCVEALDVLSSKVNSGGEQWKSICQKAFPMGAAFA